MGFCGEHILLTSQPGLYLYSSTYSSGGLHQESCNFGEYGPKYTVGDVVGCGIDWEAEVCFFTLNGQKLRKLFQPLRLKSRLI